MNAFKKSKQKFNIKSIIFYAIAAVFCVAVCIVSLCLNVTHSVALEQEIRCGVEEHIHTDSCYNGDFLECEKVAHAHDGNCYIVLLKENDINEILTLLTNSSNRSLEYVITDTMSSALNFNSNINSAEASDEQSDLPLNQDTVARLNTTISDEEELPDIVLNENINNIQTLALEAEQQEQQEQQSNSVSALSIGDAPSTATKKANFYVLIDGEWTSIGPIDFTTSSNGWRYYDGNITTSTMLNHINSALGTSFTYRSFGISVATAEEGPYSTQNVSIGSSTTRIVYRQSSSNAQATRYVRLIERGGDADSENFAFYTVKLVYGVGITDTKYIHAGEKITLPSGNYTWESDGKSYRAGESVTINAPTTFNATISSITVNYDVNFPTVSGVTVSTKPTLAGLTVTTTTDNFLNGSSAVVRNVSKQSVEGKVNNNATGLGRMIQFRGWRVGDSDVILQPNTNLVWGELVQYAGGNTEFDLTAVWDTSALQTATFFIRFDSVAVDSGGNVTGQDQNLYTDQLFAAYVGGIDLSLTTSQLHEKYHIVDKTADNSFTADQQIRALYGEQTDGVWLSAFPTDDYVFESLVEYAKTGYLSVDGEPVAATDLNSKAYAIRWYVFKAQDDAWHIDGKLVRKEGLIHVYKTFAGNKELLNDAKSDFYIEAVDDTTGVITLLDMTNYKSHDEATDTYMWEITNVKYGEKWHITEYPHKFESDEVLFGIYSEYTVHDAHGDQSVSAEGTSVTVSGMTYALDEGSHEVLRAHFTNIYNRANSIIIKKQDAITGNSIGGAAFSLSQNGTPLKFDYDAKNDVYIHNQENGSITKLEGNANGYFEISIENFSYDLGPIVVHEVTAPTGYTPIGDIEIGYTDDDNTIGILSGNSELIKYINGVLIIGNSTDSASVTAKKEWDCPETEWQDVTMQLLADGKLVTTVISGVEPQVVLNKDNNWQHTWENLPLYVNGKKIEWSVKETKIGIEAAKSDGSFINWLVSYELPIKSTDANGKENTLLIVTNTTKRVMLRLTKTDLSNTLQLSGAKFVLQAVDSEGNPLENEIEKTAETGQAGTLIFDNLKTAVRYRLTEIAAPEGYVKTDEFIFFTINEDGSVTVEDSFYASAGGTAYNITVRNAKLVDLPDSGGIGNSIFYFFGLILMSIGIYIGTTSKRRCRS